MDISSATLSMIPSKGMMCEPLWVHSKNRSPPCASVYKTLPPLLLGGQYYDRIPVCSILGGCGGAVLGAGLLPGLLLVSSDVDLGEWGSLPLLWPLRRHRRRWGVGSVLES